MATGVKLGSMYWETGVDNAGLQRGLDQGQAAVQGFANQASGSFSAIAVAAGNLLATGIEKLAGGILAIGKNAISATADMQAMQVGMEGLLAREIARGEEATRTYQVTSSLSAEEQQQVTDLTLKLDKMNAQLQEKKQHLWEIQNTWTDEGLAAKTAAADIAVFENNIAKTAAQLEALQAKQGAVNTVTEKYWINTTSISEAMPQAQERAKALMDELARISILSPYEVDAVQQTFKLAMAFGYTADEATKYTKAILNVAAGTGASNEMLQRMAYNFAQIRMQGKVTAVDIRQLAMAGFDLNSVLVSVGQQFGVTIRNHEDFNAAIANGSITWAQFTEGFAKYADDNFGGASERMSRTLNGLKSTFSDLFKLTLPKIAGPALEEVTGLLSDFLDGLLKIRETGILDTLGQKLGAFTSKAVAGIRGLAKLPGVVKELSDVDPRSLSELNDILSVLPDGLQGLAKGIADLVNAYQEGGIAGVFKELFDDAAQWWKSGGQQWLSDAANTAWEWIQKLPAEVGAKVSGWISGAWDTLRNVWEGIYKWWDTGGSDWVSTTVDTVWSYVTQLPGKIGEKVSGWVETAKGFLADAWQAIKDWWDTGGGQWVTDTVDKIWTYVQQLPGKIGEKLTEGGMAAGSWLADVWTGLHGWWDTEGSQWVSDAAGKIGTAVDNLRAFLTSDKVPGWVSSAVLWLEPVWMATANWWTEKAEPLTREMLAGFDRWMTRELVPALKNSDKSTWANGVGEALSSGFQQAIDYLYTPEVSARFAEAIMHFYVKAAFDAVGMLLSVPVGIVQALVNALFSEGGEPVDLGPAVDWILTVFEGVFRGAIDGFTESKAGQMLIQFVTFIIDGLKAAFGIGSGSGGVKVASITEVGTGLVDGLWSGISGKAGELLTNVQTFVSDNIAHAVEWSSALIEAGHMTIDGLIVGLKDKAGDVVAWVEKLVGGIIAAVMKMLDMGSPSKVFREIGVNIIAGLTQGLGAATPEAVQAMTDSMSQVLGAVGTIAGGLGALSQVGGMPSAAANLRLLIEQIKALIPMLHDLAKFYASPDANLALQSAKAIVDPLADIFGSLRSVIEAAAAVAKAGVSVDDLDSANSIMDGLMALIQTLVARMGQVGGRFSADTLMAAIMLAETVGPVLDAFAAAAETVGGLQLLALSNVDAQVDLLVSVIERLVAKIAWLANAITPEVLNSSAKAAEMIIQALAPWRVMIDTYNAFADLVLRSGIGEKAKALTTVIERLILKITWLANSIGEETLTNSAEVAGLLIDALAPWKVMIDTYMAFADLVIAGGVGDKVKAMTTVIERLILKITWLANSIGDETLQNSARVAAMIVEALSPWQAMMDVLNALGTLDQIGEVGDKARELADMAEVLVRALAALASSIGEDTLEAAARVGRLLSDVLAPWEAAIQLSDDMRAWQIMPDFEDRMIRFARQWVTIVESLAQAVGRLEGEGLQLVADFGDALGALVGGLSDALELALALPDTWTDPVSWQPFVTWVQDAFMEFYTWINGWDQGGTRPPVPWFDSGALDLVGQFGDALSALMGGLSAALQLALALPETWTVPPSWDTFVTWVQGVFVFFANWIASWESSEPQGPVPQFGGQSMDVVGQFGEALGALMGGLQAALNLALALPETWTEPASWVPFAGWVQTVFADFATWVGDNFPTPEDPEASDQFGAITGFGNALGALMNGLSTALDLALALPAEWSIPDSWVPFRDWVATVFGEFMTWVSDNFPTPEDPEAPDQFGAITGFGGALEALMGGLSAALELALALPETWEAPSTDTWDAFFGFVTDVFDAFVAYVDENYPSDPDEANQFAPVAAFGDAMSAVFDGLTAALDLFVGLANWTGPSSTFNTRLDNFLSAVLTAINDIAAWVALNIDPDNLPALTAFGEAISSVVGGLSDALDLFAALADTDPNVYTESTLFEDRVGNLLASISGTMTAFQEYIVGPLGETAWDTAAQAFYDAIDGMFSTLSTALGFFADLEESGLPPTAAITDFVGVIADLFEALGVQLGNLTTPNGSLTLAIAAVEGAVGGFPASMNALQPQWWTAAGNLGGQIAAALLSKVGTVGDPGSAGTIWGALGHISWTLDQWTPGSTMLAAYFQRGVSLAQQLVDGMLSLAGTNEAMWQAGYALAQSGLDGFDAGAGLAGLLEGTMPDSQPRGGWTMDTTHTWQINLVGVGSPTGIDLSFAAVDQIADALRDKLMRGG